ncbi:hypothetical protein KAI87_03175 [Myxococcota bacterium]|nr:hypothetical protein [Myxococcota bacterium]
MTIRIRWTAPLLDPRQLSAAFTPALLVNTIDDDNIHNTPSDTEVGEGWIRWSDTQTAIAELIN